MIFTLGHQGVVASHEIIGEKHVINILGIASLETEAGDHTTIEVEAFFDRVEKDGVVISHQITGEKHVITILSGSAIDAEDASSSEGASK